jgi:hypothetical protein
MLSLLIGLIDPFSDEGFNLVGTPWVNVDVASDVIDGVLKNDPFQATILLAVLSHFFFCSELKNGGFFLLLFQIRLGRVRGRHYKLYSIIE